MDVANPPVNQQIDGFRIVAISFVSNSVRRCWRFIAWTYGYFDDSIEIRNHCQQRYFDDSTRALLGIITWSYKAENNKGIDEEKRLAGWIRFEGEWFGCLKIKVADPGYNPV